MQRNFRFLLKDYLPECPSEVPVEDGVDDGVEGRVHVAQPKSQLEGPSAGRIPM